MFFYFGVVMIGWVARCTDYAVVFAGWVARCTDYAVVSAGWVARFVDSEGRYIGLVQAWSSQEPIMNEKTYLYRSKWLFYEISIFDFLQLDL